MTALQNGDIETMDRTVAAIRGRCGVVTAEMDNYEGAIIPNRFWTQLDFFLDRFCRNLLL